MRSENEISAIETNVTDQPLENFVEVATSESGSSQDLSDSGREDFVEAETLEHKIASLVLCMQTVLHVSKCFAENS